MSDQWTEDFTLEPIQLWTANYACTLYAQRRSSAAKRNGGARAELDVTTLVGAAHNLKTARMLTVRRGAVATPVSLTREQAALARKALKSDSLGKQAAKRAKTVYGVPGIDDDWEKILADTREAMGA